MMRFLKKTIGVMLIVCILVSCCMVLVSADVSNSRSTGQLSSGIYRLKNVGSEKYLDSSYNGIGNGVEQVSMKSIDAGQLDQAFKVTYLGMYGGEPCYSIRPMENYYSVLGSTYPEYTDVAEFHDVSINDDYNILGEENVWYIIPDGNYYKLKNKYFGEAVYDIYGDDSYINNAYLCAADDEDFSKLMISFIDESCPDYGKWELRPCTYPLENLDIINHIVEIPVGATHDFDSIAYSTRISVNEPVEFSVENVEGIAEINSYSGVLQAVSPGLVRVVITYGDMTRKYDVYIEGTENNEYYIMNTWDGTDSDSAEDDKYIYINAENQACASQFSNGESNSSFEDVRIENVKWTFERYGNTQYFAIKNEHLSSQYCYLTLSSNSEGRILSLTSVAGGITDNHLWSINRTSDGSYTIKSKVYSSTNYVVAGVPGLATDNLIISKYNSNSNYIYKWKIYGVGSDVTLLSIKEDTHDHIIGLSQTLPHLYNSGYNSFDFIDIELNPYNIGQINANSIKNQIINKMENSRVFISRSHGNYNTNESYLALWSQGTNVIKALSATDIYDYTTQMVKVDLSGCDMALFVACYTAKEGVYTLPEAAVDAGAKCAIGFKENVSCGASSDWAREFLKQYENNYANSGVTVSTMANNASDIVNGYDAYRDVEETHIDTYSIFLSE